MSADKDNLLDPSNPKSPYNRYNYDSPFSVRNPNSSYYDPDLAMAPVITYLLVGLFVVGLFLLNVVWSLLGWVVGLVLNSMPTELSDVSAVLIAIGSICLGFYGFRLMWRELPVPQRIFCVFFAAFLALMVIVGSQ